MPPCGHRLLYRVRTRISIPSTPPHPFNLLIKRPLRKGDPTDIDNPYVRYEGEIRDADINRMVDSMQVGGSSEVDDDDIDRMIDSMQVDGGGNQSSGRETSPGGQRGAGGSRGSSSERASAIHNPIKARARAKGNVKKESTCRGQHRRVQTLMRWTVESRNKMIAALKHSHGVT